MLQHRGSYLLDESGLPLRVSSIKFDRVRLSVSSLRKYFRFANRNSEFSIENPKDCSETCMFDQNSSTSTRWSEVSRWNRWKRKTSFDREKLRPLYFATEPSCIDRILLPALRRSFLRLDLPRACLVYELAQMAIDAPFMETNMPSPPVDSSDSGGFVHAAIQPDADSLPTTQRLTEIFVLVRGNPVVSPR